MKTILHTLLFLFYVIGFTLLMQCTSNEKKTGSGSGSLDDNADLVPVAEQEDQLNATVLAVSPTQKTIAGTNQIYCCTMLMCLEQLLKKSEDNYQFLNEFIAPGYHKDVIEEKYHLVFSGIKSKENLYKLHEHLKSRYNYNGLPSLEEDKERSFAYAYLKKSIVFEEEFDTLSEYTFGKEKIPVKMFGFLNYDYSRAGYQATLMHYKNDDEFVVRLEGTDPEHEIIIAMTPAGKSLLETYNSVTKLKTEDYLKGEDMLAIPEIKLDIFHRFDDMINKPSDQGAFYIAECYQKIIFQLNYKGAELESEAYAEEAATEEMPEELKPVPKKLIVDQPFLICMKKKSAKYPYFMALIENTELMIERKEKLQ